MRPKLPLQDLQYKKNPNFYMEGCGFKFIYRLLQFVTILKPRNKYLIDSKPKDVNNSQFLSVCTADIY